MEKGQNEFSITFQELGGNSDLNGNVRYWIPSLFHTPQIQGCPWTLVIVNLLSDML